MAQIIVKTQVATEIAAAREEFSNLQLVNTFYDFSS